MNVSLSPRLEAWIQEKVRSGFYQSASEVIREALRLLREREQLRELHVRELKKQLQIGLDQLDKGESQPLDDELIDEVKRRGQSRLRADSK